MQNQSFMRADEVAQELGISKSHAYKVIHEDFYASHRFYSFQDFKDQLAVRERAYNNFPIRPLAWRSPKQVLFAFHNV